MPAREQKSHESRFYQGLSRERGIVVACGEAEQNDSLFRHLFEVLQGQKLNKTSQRALERIGKFLSKAHTISALGTRRDKSVSVTLIS